MRPDLCEVKDVVTELLGLFWCHGLLSEPKTVNKSNALSLAHGTHNIDSPARVLLILDSLEEALNTVFWIRTGEFASLLIVQDLDSLIGPYVDLGVNIASVLLDVFEGVTGVSVHVMIAVRSSAIGEEDHDLMDGLGVLGQVILLFRARCSGQTPTRH